MYWAMQDRLKNDILLYIDIELDQIMNNFGEVGRFLTEESFLLPPHPPPLVSPQSRVENH